jgi:hypothetical protein
LHELSGGALGRKHVTAALDRRDEASCKLIVAHACTP